jgi:ribosomal protein S17E
MSDLVVRIFGEYLSHTPLRVLGINTSIEFSVGSEEIRNKIGHKLAPPDAWGEWAPRIKEKNQLGRGGMRRLAMEQKGLDDRGAGHIIADIRPSKDKDTNIVMEINDQYELKLSEDSQENTKCIIEYIDKNFEKSIKNSEWIVEQIMSLKNAV